MDKRIEYEDAYVIEGKFILRFRKGNQERNGRKS